MVKSWRGSGGGGGVNNNVGDVIQKKNII
jgi:hypothetical protein